MLTDFRYAFNSIPTNTMSTRKRFDKKNAQTFALVYRSHEDAQFYDEDAGQHVLVPVNKKSNHKNDNNNNNNQAPLLHNTKIKTKAQLEKELADELEAGKIRGNEGEAALYGITYDDSSYDYMQHLRTIGDGHGVFIPKKNREEAGGSSSKTKDIQFKDELPIADLEEEARRKQITYQDMQNVPDSIAGFKPDMDPKLREVLEALEDEEYVEEDDDIFNDLLQGGERSDDDYGDEEDEWDLDNFDDAGYDSDQFKKEGDQGWEADFRKFEHFNKNKKNDWDSDDEFEDEEEEDNDVVPELPAISRLKGKGKSKTKQRKKKGAMTDTSSFSMSSSALFRSEGLTVLDDKFERLQLNYDKEEDEEEDQAEEAKEFDLKKERTDFEGMLDDFLENYELEKGGRRIVKKNETKKKLQQAADSVSRGKLAKKRNKKIVI